MGADPFQTRWPGLWSLLNARGRRELPCALAEYVENGLEGSGARWLDLAEAQLQSLLRKCGKKAVCDVYRRRMSGLREETELTALLCEIHICATVARLCGEFTLVSPRQGQRIPEFEAVLGGQRLCGEVKRYRWKEGEEECPDIGEVRLGPLERAQSLAQKLDDDLRPKFTAGAINLGFVHRPSGGDVYGSRWAARSILERRGRARSPVSAEMPSEEDVRCALQLAYSMPGWEVVSGTFLVRLSLSLVGGHVRPEARWLPNPQAATPLSAQLSEAICKALRSVQPPTD